MSRVAYALVVLCLAVQVAMVAGCEKKQAAPTATMPPGKPTAAATIMAPPGPTSTSP